MPTVAIGSRGRRRNVTDCDDGLPLHLLRMEYTRIERPNDWNSEYHKKVALGMNSVLKTCIPIRKTTPPPLAINPRRHAAPSSLDGRHCLSDGFDDDVALCERGACSRSR
jgi:hypothetical protein